MRRRAGSARRCAIASDSFIGAALRPDPAAWAAAGVRGFAESVLSVVPAGFEAYLRLFHPAYRSSPGGRAPVRWTEIARACGARPHAGMQLGAITGGERPGTKVSPASSIGRRSSGASRSSWPPRSRRRWRATAARRRHASLAALPDVEALVVPAATGVDWLSDAVNPPPSEAR